MNRAFIGLGIRALVAAFVLIALPSAVFAQADGSSIKIVKVHVWPVGGGDGYVPLAVDFVSMGDKPVVAVKFDIDLVDAFGTVLSSQTVSVYGNFTQDAFIQGAGTPQVGVVNSQSPLWDLLDGTGGAGVQWHAHVIAVRFDDGTVWTKPE